MIKEFFLDKFEYDFHCNQMWCEHLEAIEDELSLYTRRSFSHIINVHHIWISRLMQSEAESHTWDVLPLSYWERLCQTNYLQTRDYLEKIELNSKIDYTSEEGVQLSKTDIDVLYHILNHSNYHRAQIAKELRDQGLAVPAFNFISYK